MKKNNKVILFALITTLLLVIIPINNVVAEGELLSTNFEDIAGGSTYGETGDFYYAAVSGNTTSRQKISTYYAKSGTRSLWFTNVGSPSASAYLNLSDPIDELDYVGYFSFWYRCKDDGGYTGGQDRITMYIKNNGYTQLEFTFGENYYLGSNFYGLSTYDLGSGRYYNIKSHSNTWFKLTCFHLGTNQFMYIVYDTTGVPVATKTFGGANASTWTTFDQIYFSTWANNDEWQVWIDDFTFSNSTQGQNPHLLSSILQINDNVGTQNVCRGLRTRFEVTGIGEQNFRFCINITDPNDELIYTVCSLTESYVFYQTYFETGNYTLGVYDPLYMEDGYSEMYQFEVIDCGTINYSDYGDFFAEFYTDGDPCYYNDGSYPEVVIYLNDITNYSTDDGRYIIDFYEMWALNETRVGSFTAYNGTDIYQQTIYQFAMSSIYAYEIRVYNCTSTGGVYARDERIYTSFQVMPCGDFDGDGIPDNEDDTPYGEDEDEEEDDGGITGDTDLQILVGLGVTIGLGIVVAVLLGSPLGFFMGAIPTAYALSIEELGDLQMFPTEMGIGLIALLTIVAVILWFISR